MNKKLVAKTTRGKEFLHSKSEAYFAPSGSADKMCKMMNGLKFRLKGGEIWHVYDYDIMQEAYVTHRLSLYRGILKLKAV